MPSWAASNRPSRARSAPVNAPRSWPNSSLSRSVSVKAAQLTATRGLEAAAAAAVNRAGYQFLAGPGLSSDENRRVRWRDAGDLLAQARESPGSVPVISEEPSRRNTVVTEPARSRASSRVCSTARASGREQDFRRQMAW